MPRVQIKALPRYDFSFTIEVRTTDLNYGGHLGNDRLLTLVHEARVAFLKSKGWSELECAGTSLIMGDVAIIFKGEAFAGDLLVFKLAAGDPSHCGFRIFHSVTRKKDGAKIALVETGMTCFDYQNRKIAPLPEAIAQICTFSDG